MKLIFCLLFISAFAKAEVPFMNIFSYRDKLLADKNAAADCPMNLRLREKYRAQDFNSLVRGKAYTVSEKTQDDKWAEQFQNYMLSEKSGKKPGDQFYPGFYSLADFASYQVGPEKIKWSQDRGFTYKIFFTFKNPESDLTPDIYKAFSKKLADSDFEGDSKIPLIRGWIRFGWNNVILHAPSLASAQIAEKVGLEVFAKKLESYSRGVDMANPLNTSTPKN